MCTNLTNTVQLLANCRCPWCWCSCAVHSGLHNRFVVFPCAQISFVLFLPYYFMAPITNLIWRKWAKRLLKSSLYLNLYLSISIYECLLKWCQTCYRVKELKWASMCLLLCTRRFQKVTHPSIGSDTCFFSLKLSADMIVVVMFVLIIIIIFKF